MRRGGRVRAIYDLNSNQLRPAGWIFADAFDLDAKEFSWGMQVVTSKFKFQGRAFDPRKDDGPLMLNKLHLNNLHCTRGGLYISGMKTGGMLLFNGREVNMAVELPPGTHNARPFRNGVLFNDTAANLLRYADRDGREDRAMPVPTYPAESLLHADMDQSGLARQGFARGLAVLSDSVVAGGSSPSTVTVSPGRTRLAAARANARFAGAIAALRWAMSPWNVVDGTDVAPPRTRASHPWA